MELWYPSLACTHTHTQPCYFNFFFFMVLTGVKPRASSRLRNYSISEINPQLSNNFEHSTEPVFPVGYILRSKNVANKLKLCLVGLLLEIGFWLWQIASIRPTPSPTMTRRGKGEKNTFFEDQDLITQDPRGKENTEQNNKVLRSGITSYKCLNETTASPEFYLQQKYPSK